MEWYLSQMDREVGIAFNSDFNFSLAALLYKGAMLMHTHVYVIGLEKTCQVAKIRPFNLFSYSYEVLMLNQSITLHLILIHCLEVNL